MLAKPKRNITQDLDRKAAARDRARERYREEHGVVLAGCHDNLAQLDDLARVQVVTLPGGRTSEEPVISATSLAEPLNTTAVTTTRWVTKGMLPAPVLQTSRGGAYHIEEAKVILKVIGDHQMVMKQYRATHTETKDRLFEQVARIRRSIFK